MQFCTYGCLPTCDRTFPCGKPSATSCILDQYLHSRYLGMTPRDCPLECSAQQLVCGYFPGQRLSLLRLGSGLFFRLSGKIPPVTLSGVGFVKSACASLSSLALLGPSGLRSPLPLPWTWACGRLDFSVRCPAIPSLGSSFDPLHAFRFGEALHPGPWVVT